MKKTLYHKGKSGELRVWSVWVEGNKVFTEYGVLDGAMQIASKECVGKNIGKTNETTPNQQALLEAESLYNFKKDRKYSTTPEAAELPLSLPMLADKYDPKKTKCEGWFVQPKYNGVRCISRWENGKVVLVSRSNKLYEVAHISEQVAKFLPENTELDGELYIHGMPLQNIISLVKKAKDGSENIQYRVYDCPVFKGYDEWTFEARNNALKDLKEICVDSPSIYFSPTKFTDGTPGDVARLHKEFVDLGYEGIMLRNPEGLYLSGYRSKDLLKVKSFQDAEFVVVGVNDGDGKMKGHAILVCKNDLNDLTFNVTPKAPMEERKRIFDNKEDFIGRKYTVQFFERSNDLIPIFPVGLAFPEDK